MKWNQLTGLKLGKEYVKAVYCHPAYLTYMQNKSCKMPGWMNHKLESRFPGRNINNLRYEDDTTLMAESKEEKTSLLMMVKHEREKAGLKLNIKKKKNEDHGIWFHHFIANRWENKGKSDTLYFPGLQNHCSLLTAAMKLKDACSLEEKLGWT